MLPPYSRRSASFRLRIVRPFSTARVRTTRRCARRSNRCCNATIANVPAPASTTPLHQGPADEVGRSEAHPQAEHEGPGRFGALLSPRSVEGSPSLRRPHGVDNHHRQQKPTQQHVQRPDDPQQARRPLVSGPSRRPVDGPLPVPHGRHTPGRPIRQSRQEPRLANMSHGNDMPGTSAKPSRRTRARRRL